MLVYQRVSHHVPLAPEAEHVQDEASERFRAWRTRREPRIPKPPGPACPLCLGTAARRAWWMGHDSGDGDGVICASFPSSF